VRCPHKSSLHLLSRQRTAGRDAVIILIEASESMFEPIPDNDGKSAFYSALETALLFQKKKIVSDSRDQVGVVIFNTVCSYVILGVYKREY
jgi:hypothetical protein